MSHLPNFLPHNLMPLIYHPPSLQIERLHRCELRGPFLGYFDGERQRATHWISCLEGKKIGNRMAAYRC